MAFCKTKSRLLQTAVLPTSLATDENQFGGLIWHSQARVIATHVLYHSEWFDNKMKVISCVFLDKLPSLFSQADYD